MKNRLLLAAFVTATIAIAAFLLSAAHLLPPFPATTATLRWLAIALFAVHATARRSLTAWIFVGLFSGAVIAETIFAWPGVGRLFVQAMFARDYPLLMGILMMGSFLVVFFNLVADVAYGWLDPRIAYE